MIRSFADRDTAKLARRERVRRFQSIERAALRKLAMVAAAAALDDLRVPPGNRLEALRGDRAGQFSVRINDQYRICFRWENGDAHDVEICDYH
ncbi:MAG: type II toxin-antitoxin system RelE/ParE family toxin [Pseudomonadota bacterium]